ncbi:MAG TPA: SHOCT domain-containing protein [Candidatus Dormibacteraeota bacterium]|nr:SHOCT domain-containing protein [Candidatus Dormibacteraeota bacterium]
MGTLGFFPFGLLSALTGVLLLVGFVLLIVWLVRTIAGPHAMRWSGPAVASAVAVESPMDILACRFASGAISAEEYQKAREVLAEAPKP